MEFKWTKDGDMKWRLLIILFKLNLISRAELSEEYCMGDEAPDWVSKYIYKDYKDVSDN